MNTLHLVAIEMPDRRYVVRVKNGHRLGTIFANERGWFYQFDGTSREGARCKGPREALEIMEAVAEQQRLLEPDKRP